MAPRVPPSEACMTTAGPRMNLRPELTVRTLAGAALEAGKVRVTPESRVLVLRLPFGGLVWQRPSAVVVQREDRVERLCIVDITRVAQLVLWACAVAAWLVARRTPAP